MNSHTRVKTLTTRTMSEKAKLFDGEKFKEIELDGSCYQTELAIGEASWIMLIKD